MALPSPLHVPILTPCIGICRLDAQGLCEGCRRTLQEIAAWSSYSDEQRRHLIDDVLPKRVAPRSA